MINNVELKKIQVIGGQEIYNRRAVVDTKSGIVLGTVSPKYKPIQNAELLKTISPAVEELRMNPNPIITSAKHGAVTFFRFFGEKLTNEIKAGDIVQFGLEFYNSYDGSMNFGFHFIALRLVCTNGLTVPRTISTINFRHVQSANIKEIKNRVESQFPKITSAVTLWKNWSGIHPEQDSVVRFLAEAVPGNRLQKEFGNRFFGLPQKEQTLWGLYNVFTYYITHNIKTQKKGDLKPIRQFDMTENLTNRMVKFSNDLLQGE